MSIPNPEPNFDWIAQNGLWLILVVVVVLAVIAFFVVRWDRRERPKARTRWEQDHPGQSWDWLNDRPPS